MNRKDFYHVNENDPLRGKTILVYMHSEYYIVTTKDGENVHLIMIRLFINLLLWYYLI